MAKTRIKKTGKARANRPAGGGGGRGAIHVGARSLSLADVRAVAIDGRNVVLDPEAVRRIERGNRFLQEKVRSGETYYGINTGFGLLSNVRIEDADIEQLQVNLIRSHAVGIGPAMPDSVVRAMLLLRAANLCAGHSGVPVTTVRQIIDVLNAGIVPIVPQQGSVGASGDLAPLSHLALVLIGEGRARFRGREVSGGQALEEAGLEPIRLGPKEGLALINGTQFMTAVGVLALLDAEHLCDLADFAGAISLEALRGTSAAFDPKIHAVRPHEGQVEAARRMSAILLERGRRSGIANSHLGCDRVQDPYSLRCIPQVHGASRDALKWVRGVLEREVNSVTDNPLLFPQTDEILSGGNFHGQIVAIAMDLLSIAVAELASISEQRIEKLVNPAISGLPAFLTRRGGLNSGFMIVQVSAASVVSENKTLCHPASVDSIPTSADKEDHVSMGAWAARKASRVVTNARRVLAMELIAGAQGMELLRPLRSSRKVERMFAAVREKASFMEEDRSLHEEMTAVERAIETMEWRGLVQV